MLPTLSAGGGGTGLGARAAVYGAAFPPLQSGGAGFGGGNAAWSRYLRRAFSVAQWDLEVTFYQIINSFRSPAKVYKLTQHRKQTKNQWARDDPAFACLMAAFLAVCAVGYGVAYEYESPLTYAWLILMAWLHFALSGVLVATACWAAANKHMRAPNSLPHSVEQEVEWLYAWDVHCNSFVPILLLLYAGQYLALPLLMRDGLLPALAANALYAAAASHYVYITFSGYLGARGDAARPCGAVAGGAAVRCARAAAAPGRGVAGTARGRAVRPRRPPPPPPPPHTHIHAAPPRPRDRCSAHLAPARSPAPAPAHTARSLAVLGAPEPLPHAHWAHRAAGARGVAPQHQRGTAHAGDICGIALIAYMYAFSGPCMRCTNLNACI